MDQVANFIFLFFQFAASNLKVTLPGHSCSKDFPKSYDQLHNVIVISGKVTFIYLIKGEPWLYIYILYISISLSLSLSLSLALYHLSTLIEGSGHATSSNQAAREDSVSLSQSARSRSLKVSLVPLIRKNLVWENKSNQTNSDYFQERFIAFHHCWAVALHKGFGTTINMLGMNLG